MRRGVVWAAGFVAVAALVAWSARASPHPPPRFFVRTDGPTVGDEQGYDAPGERPIRGWVFGKYGCGSHGFFWCEEAARAPGPYQTTFLDDVRERVGLERADRWRTWPVRCIHADDRWCEFVWIPDEFPPDAVPDAALAGTWTDVSGERNWHDESGRLHRDPAEVAWRLEADGRLFRDHPATCAATVGKWACLDDVLYLSWRPVWSPERDLLEVRVVDRAAGKWRRSDAADEGVRQSLSFVR